MARQARWEGHLSPLEPATFTLARQTGRSPNISKTSEAFTTLQPTPRLRSPRPCRVACNPCDGDAAERIHEGLTRGVLVAPALLGETEDERRADRSSKARRQQTTLRRAGRTTSRVDGAAQPGRRVPSSRFTGGPLKVKLHPQPSRVNGGSSSWRRPSRPGSRPGA